MLFRCKLIVLVYKNVCTVINLPTKRVVLIVVVRVFKQYHSNRDFSAFYLQDGGENGGHGYETKLRHRHAMCKESVYYTGGIGERGRATAM